MGSSNVLQFNFQYQNVGGMNTKLFRFFKSATGCGSDLIAVSETWLTDSVSSLEIVDSNLYNVFRKDRCFDTLGVTRGGGVMLLVRKQFQVECIDLEQISHRVWTLWDVG
mgnify:FL=1